MRHHHKRSRTLKEPDDDPYLKTREEEVHSESYSRSHRSSHHSEEYRAPSSSSRASYHSSRDSASSRDRPADNWRYRDEPVQDRYAYNGSYHHTERASYDTPIPVPRESESWRSANDVHYSRPRTEYSNRYSQGSSTTTYPEPTWSSAVAEPYTSSKSTYYEDWPPRDTHDPALDIRSQDSVRGNKHASSDWRREPRKEKGEEKHRNESGWDRQRRDKWDDGARRKEVSTYEKAQASTEDRSWEPAASWKMSAQDQQSSAYHGQNGHRNSQSKQKLRKKGYEPNKPKRDWRDIDDGGLNNWTRREVHSAKKSTSQATKRKHSRTPTRSPSRSRSPPESYHSRRSSRGRSKSRSFSPASKRRRRDSTPVTLRSHSPNEKGRENWTPSRRQDRGYSRSASPYRGSDGVRGRKRSVSSASSVSSHRSASPDDRPRAVHRLPAMEPSATFSPKVFPNRVSGYMKDSNGLNYQNGKVKKHRGNGTYQSHQAVRSNEYPYEQSANSSSMLPPSFVPSPRSRSSQLSHVTTSVLPASEPESRERDDRSSNLLISSRVIGFRPVESTNSAPKTGGKPSSELRRFFPGDDDEMEPVSEQHSTYAAPEPVDLAPHPRYHQESSYEAARGDSRYHDVIEGHSKNGRSWTSRWEDDRLSAPNDPHVQHLRNLASPIESRRHSLPRDTYEATVFSQDAYETNPVVPVLGFSERSSAIEEVHPTPLSYDRSIAAPEQARTPPPAPQPLQETRRSPISDGPAVRDNTDVPATATPSISAHRDLYSIVSQVGEGTFGKVYKARNTVTNVHVALKRIRMESERDGFPVTAMREIKLLQSLRHTNIVRLYEMMVSNGSVYMVFEYMDHDLTGVLSQTQLSFSNAHLKSLCHQMLAGLAYLHHKGVIHRDIKGSNILVNNRGELKLGDFGLARFYQKRRRTDYTNRVITLWYRPPELLLGATVYGPEVDMWSAGCIMLELFTKKPVFQGIDEINQLDVIYKIIGTPTPDRWTGVMNLPWYELVKPQEAIPNRFRELFRKWMSPAALDLAERLLAYDPSQRVTAAQAMQASYFTQEEPAAEPPVGLAMLEGEWHEYETKREREKRKQQQHHQRRRTETAQ